jgi:8-oxo-dGTP pyrophosphatase MutT (NUDIX family)
MKTKNGDKIMFKPQCCRNCGFNGHVYKNCPHPIISFGIICYKIENNNIKYLMIQRKDSLSFMEFIRGKYDVNNIEYIKNLLLNMTICERNMILTKPFEDIWNYVWYQCDINTHINTTNDIKDINDNNNRNSKEFNESRLKFNCINDANFLKNYIMSINSIYNEQEWGFPKGRRKMRETDIDCAVREFFEETRIKKEDLSIITDIVPFEEIFFGTNGIMYKHLYYVSKLTNLDVSIKIDPLCLEQVREIRSIKWYNYNEVISHIKLYNTERIELFKFANKKICEYEKISI